MRKLGWFALWFCSSVQAHLDLYHHLEVSLVENDRITIYATIHDSDLGGRDFRKFIQDAYDLQLLKAENFEIDEAETGLAEGCQLAFASAPNPGRQLQISLAAKAEKRLLLVITRPAEFPETRDLAPGDSFSINLPEPPPKPQNLGWIWIAGAIIAVVAFCLLRLRLRPV
ncbi:MAG: hypothetical protein AAF585_15345 [Verrucomicrobiota bacterium]